MEKIVNKLIEKNKTISTMESCTGGALASEITNIEGSSSVLKYSAITYSNEFKIKMGVSSKIIEEFSVYSMQTANEMSLNISKFTNSDYGVGITGKLNRADENNNFGEDNVVFISIYDKANNKFYNKELKVTEKERKDNKLLVINEVKNMLLEII